MTSGKSSLVHRYLTGSYVDKESPEGRRLKRDVFVEGAIHLLLQSDESSIKMTSYALDDVINCK